MHSYVTLLWSENWVSTLLFICEELTGCSQWPVTSTDTYHWTWQLLPISWTCAMWWERTEWVERKLDRKADELTIECIETSLRGFTRSFVANMWWKQIEWSAPHRQRVPCRPSRAQWSYSRLWGKVQTNTKAPQQRTECTRTNFRIQLGKWLEKLCYKSTFIHVRTDFKSVSE